MVIINCKKCTKDVEMPNKRYKICYICNRKNNKDDIIIKNEVNVISSNENRLLEIYYLIKEISSYLTIYELYNFYQTSKETKNIIDSSELWIYMCNRDFKLNIDDMSFSMAIGLDSCQICNSCLTYNCNYRHCIYSKNISKTLCQQYYKLSDEELSKIQSIIKYNNFYRKDITMFNQRQVKYFIVNKHYGLTNFVLYRNKLDNIIEERRKKRDENKIKKDKEFQEWKNEYVKTFNYSNMTNDERRDLIDLELSKNDMIRRNDSMLCKEFIKGRVRDKSIDHIVAILKMTRILFSYNHIIYTMYNNDCNAYLEKLMFKNRRKKNYSWLDSVNDTYKNYKKRFDSVIVVYYGNHAFLY
jgi:hypothetical protein